MSRLSQQFSIEDQPEVFFSTTAVSHLISYAVRTGKARRLGPRLYATNLSDSPTTIVRRNWSRIAEGYFPGSVIADRTALEYAPAKDGSVFLVAQSTREVKLPGLRLRPRHGVGPVEGDRRWQGLNLYLSSAARAYLENTAPSRSRGESVARTLDKSELEIKLDEYGRYDPNALNELRDQAQRLVPKLKAQQQFQALDGLIGALLGTRDEKLSSAQARARRRGMPFDRNRIELFEVLTRRLLASAAPRVSAVAEFDNSTFAFFEAYFSNYIEGTEFTLEEAMNIVFKGEIPVKRPADAHDILGTYLIVVDSKEQRRVPHSASELIEVICSQHRMMLGERPEVGPGEFKQKPNRAGATEFVLPNLVEGTLREAFGLYISLPEGFARAAFTMFLISEVHPFTDGNGRIARILMNSELSAAGEQRIIVATRNRGDYLSALRGMTHNANSNSYFRVLAKLQLDTAAIDYSSRRKAERDLGAVSAFTDPDVM